MIELAQALLLMLLFVVIAVCLCIGALYAISDYRDKRLDRKMRLEQHKKYLEKMQYRQYRAYGKDTALSGSSFFYCFVCKSCFDGNKFDLDKFVKCPVCTGEITGDDLVNKPNIPKELLISRD